jgi:Tol biopolymer transport system component
MLRPNLPSLAATLALAALVFAACGSGASPVTTPAGGATQPTSTTVASLPAATAAATSAAATLAPGTGRIAYGVRAADGSANIFSVLPDGTSQSQLTTGAGNHLCAAYSADGKQIAYCADVSGNFEIWTMRADGTQQVQLTHLGGRALFPDFSRDGTKIAFGGVEAADSHTEIYVVDATTGADLAALTSCAGMAQGCSNDYPAWSPDDSLIVYIHQDDVDANENGVNEQVWVMNADGTNQHALTTGSAPKDQVPDWSPDGTRIAYASGTGDDEGIWLMNADGSSPLQLSGCRQGDASPCAAGSDFGPVWSPDGTRIAFLRAFQGLGKDDRPIYVMNADGSDQHRLMEGTILQAVPAWQASAAGA